ncbi:type II toxin-antitoxin system PemK/MazF family toxin [Sulfurovum riftiae]|uniref:mRNA interferase n=1 Tax=Sulfurovum riftiae TaxID=1630136 RepID=A0A151CGA1_9BACT|nr:type II toxin-antitoxin system PemK/MazF family toxin [Sulfurovum riftiae]KYJ86572.1 PemK family transcriptional regulator [Sulfurovum riftiae]
MNIEQGEIWLVEFFPKVGSEIAKRRPAIVVSHNSIGRLPLKTIVPVTDWKMNYTHYPWMIKVGNNRINGLSKISAVDCFQVKNFSHSRFVEKLGNVDAKLLVKIHETIVKTLNPIYIVQ